MDCKFCNAPMEDGQELCPACGRNVTEETASENAFAIEAEDEEAQAALDAAAKAPKKKGGSKAVIGWVVAVILVLVVAAGALFAYEALKNGNAAPVEDITVQGGSNYTVATEDMTEETLQAVVAHAEKNGVLRLIKEKLGMTGSMKEGLTNAQLAMYYWDSFYNFYNTYGYYAMMMGLDPLTMDITEYQEGQTWQEYFLSQALNLYRSQTSIADKAQREGYVLSEEMESELAATEESLRAMEDIDEQLLMVYGPGVTLDAYLEYLRGQYYYSGYLSDYEENLTYTDEELAAHYEENAESYEAQGIYKDVEAVDSKAAAEAIYAQWQAGEATEESFAALATEHTTDPGSQQTGGLYENVYEGQMVSAFNDWCLDEARQPGDTGIVETDYGHHIMYFVSKNEDGTVNVRHILIQSMDPDAWKETVAEDYVSHKLSEIITETGRSYVMDLDLSRIALAIPGQMAETAEPTQQETTDVTP